MKIFSKQKFMKDGKLIKKYKFCGITLLRKEKSPTKKKWNLLGVKVCRKKQSNLLYIISNIFDKCKGRSTDLLYIISNIFNKYKGRSTDYILIAKSKYFDGKWYLKQHPDVAKSGMDPVEHYLKYGWKEGRNPSKKFNTKEYLDLNPDVMAANINPLLHYERFGKKEGREISLYIGKINLIVKIIGKIILKLRSPKKNILLISHELTYTGAPISLLTAAKVLNENGYKVKVLSLKNGILRKEFEKYGKIFICNNINNAYIQICLSDIVIINTLIPFKYYQLAKFIKPTIWWIREPKSFLYNHVYLQNILKNATNLYTMSEYSKQEFLSFNSNINVIKHGLEDSYNNVPINTNKLSFAVVGTIYERKGQDIFLNAINMLPENLKSKATYYIVGNTGDKEFESKCRKLAPSSVNFISNFSDIKKMLKFYEKVSCIIIPSRDEPTSRIAIEAMMMGRPVIISDKVGAKYLINKKNGYIFKNENAEELSSILEKIIKNPYKLLNMSKEARTAYLENNAMTVYTNNLLTSIKCARNEKKLLVHLHLYYHEQLDYFINKLQNITCPYDLFVTIIENDIETSKKLKKIKPDVHIIKVPNRGYDVYPFWLILQQVDLHNYHSILKLHTKNQRNKVWIKNGIHYHGYEWRNDLIEPIIGSKRIFNKALKILNRHKTGLVCSKNLIDINENSKQMETTQRICSNFGYKYGKYPFCCGTIFMMKAYILSDFQHFKFKLDDFAFLSATGSTCTLAHSLETFFGIIVANNDLEVKGLHSFSTLYKCLKRTLKYHFQTLKIGRIKQYSSDLDYIKKSKYFDEKWYIKNYHDILHISPAEHYLIEGWKEGLNPSIKFNTNVYLALNPDVKRANINPLLHYEKYGKQEGRKKTIYNMVEDKKIWNKVLNCSSLGITKLKRSKKLIISLTTYPARINEVALVIYSLLKQSIKPDEIILWLGTDKFLNKEEDLPQSLLNLTANGLTIKWCKDLRSFTKLVPSLKLYPEDIIVTADDDIFYPKDWLEKMYKEHLMHPNDIICHRVHEITMIQDEIAPYNSWKLCSSKADASYYNFLTGVGGVLYPPHSLYKEVLKQGIFLKLCPHADDIWFWAMAVLNKTKIRNIKNGYSSLTYINQSREKGLNGEICLNQKNVLNNENNVQMKQVLNRYSNIKKLLHIKN